jgi:hypothetical protein
LHPVDALAHADGQPFDLVFLRVGDVADTIAAIKLLSGLRGR